MLDHSTVAALCARAVANGGLRETQMRFRWPIAGSCQSPKEVVLFARPGGKRVTRYKAVDGRVVRVGHHDERYIYVKRGTKHPLELTLETRCRRCDKCRRHRSNMWQARARAEIQDAPRTWFGTLTLRPDVMYRARLTAVRKLQEQGVDFDALPYGEQFRHHVAACSEHITTYLKRIRKACAGRLRYLLVAEYHTGNGEYQGLPHFHILIHELDLGLQVGERTLRTQWTAGFSKFKLCDDKAARYVSKYLTKNAVARVRASQRYGNNELVHSDTHVKTLTSPALAHGELPSPAGQAQQRQDAAETESSLQAFKEELASGKDLRKTGRLTMRVEVPVEEAIPWWPHMEKLINELANRSQTNGTPHLRSTVERNAYRTKSVDPGD